MQPAEDITIGAFWGARLCSVQECARTLVDVVERLTATVGPPFRDLFYGRDSPREPRRGFDGEDLDAVAGSLAKSISHRDDDQTHLPNLGYVISVDEGRNRMHQARIRLTCGLESPRLWNSVTLDLPESVEADAAGLEWVQAALRELIHATDPDWARIDSLTRLVAMDRREPSPTVGWTLYLKAGPVTIPPLPRDVEVSALGSGTLIKTTDDWFDGERDEHLRNAAEVERRLREAALLHGPGGAESGTRP